MIDELKGFLIEELHLEGVSPDDINPDAPLFDEGLGLDSIDALELAVALDKKYGVRIKAGDDRNVEIFASLTNLAKFLTEQQSA